MSVPDVGLPTETNAEDVAFADVACWVVLGTGTFMAFMARAFMARTRIGGTLFIDFIGLAFMTFLGKAFIDFMGVIFIDVRAVDRIGATRRIGDIFRRAAMWCPLSVPAWFVSWVQLRWNPPIMKPRA